MCCHAVFLSGSQFPAWQVIVRDPSSSNLLTPSSPDWSVPSSSTTPGFASSPEPRNGYRSPLGFLSVFGFQSRSES